MGVFLVLDNLWIGNRIRELRISRGLTQQEFAKKMNVSFQAVSAWERAIAPPDLGNLVEISSFFGVLLDDLVKNRGEKLVLGVDGGDLGQFKENDRISIRKIPEYKNFCKNRFSKSFCNGRGG